MAHCYCGERIFMFQEVSIKKKIKHEKKGKTELKENLLSKARVRKRENKHFDYSNVHLFLSCVEH